MDLRVAPSARTAHSLLFLPPFPPEAERCAFTCVESIICVGVDRPLPASWRNRFSQMPRPTNKSVIDGRGRTVFGRAIAPTASGLQNMHDAADDATIIRSLDTSHIPR